MYIHGIRLSNGIKHCPWAPWRWSQIWTKTCRGKRTLFKNPPHALCFKIHTKTQPLFKTLECLRLLCHPTCFGHILDHLQGIFLVQCCFPPCCFITILLGYVAVSSICVAVMYTSLLSVLLCTVTVHNKTDSRDKP